MADVTSRLRLVVDSTGVDKAGNKLRDVRAEARALDAQAKAMMGAFRGLAAVIGAAFSVQAIVKYADGWKRAENQIKTVSKSLMDVRAAQEGVFAVAQRTYSAYDATAALYTKLTRAGGGLISGQQEALRLVETVNKALAVGGASGSERNSVILQLGQAVGSGRLQGDEFRSISENAPLILDALAKSTGKARGELKELGSQGKITSEVLIKSLKDYGVEVDGLFGKFAPTIGDALTKLGNSFQKLIGENGATLFTALAGGIALLADNLDLVAKAAAIALPSMLALASPQILAGLGAIVKGIQAIGIAIASNPLGAIAVALATAAVALYEFSDQMKVSGKEAEKYGITVRDVFNEIPSAIGDGLKIAGDAVGAWFKNNFSVDQLKGVQAFFMATVDIAKFFWNRQIGLAVGTVKAMVSAFSKFPALLKDIFVSAANGVIATIEFMINQVVGRVNGFIKTANAATHMVGLNIDIPQFDPVAISRLKNDAAGTAKAIGDTFSKDINTDYIGGAIKGLGKGFDYLTERAIKTKIARDAALSQTSDAASALGASGSPLGDEEGRIGRLFTGLNDTIKKMNEFKASLEYGLVNPLEGLGKVAKSVSDKTIAALNAISAQKRLFASLKLGGIEAYRDQLAAEDAMNEAKEAGIILDQKGLDLEVQRAREARNRLADTEALYGANLAAEDALNRLFDDLPTKGLAAFKALADDLSDIFRQVWVEAMKSALNPFISSLKAELGKAFGEVFSKTKSFFSDALKKISPELSGQVSKLFAVGAQTYAGYQVGSSAANALGLGGKSGAQQQNAGIGGGAGAIIGAFLGGPIGSAIGSFIGTTIGGLLGPSSTNAAASSLLDSSGKSISGLLGGKRTAETSQAVNDFMTVLQSGYSSLKDLGGVLSVFVKNIEIGQRDPSKIDLSNGQQVRTAVGDTAAAQNAALIEVLRGTTFAVDALNKIKDGMIAAGASFQTTYDTLTQVNALLKANEPELSQWAQALKKIDDLFKPLIESTGAYTDALKDAYATAKGALATSFDKEIKNSIKGLLNSPTDQLNDLLETQAKRLEDAKAVGGNIAQVERLTALELQGFFKGLSEDALKEVQSFLGLFDEATNAVVRNLDLSRQDLRSRADAFGAFAESFAGLGSDLTERFLAASPRESLGVLRGRVQDLLGGVASGNESAAQALPQAVNKLVDAARQTFGNTSGFNDILAFAQSALGQAKDSALKVQSDAEKQIAALDANNDILSDIRDILVSSQATSAFFQSYVSGGVASSDALLSLIQKGAGLNLAANDNASALSITGLIGQSIQPMIAPLSASIDAFTARLADMPALQRLTVEAIDRGSDRIVNALATVTDRLDRLESNGRKQLAELERVNKVA